MRLVVVLCPDPLGELTALPRSPSWVKGERKRRGVGKGKGQGASRGNPGHAKMRHINPQRDKNKEFGGTNFKFGQLIFRKIIKIVATRCHILRQYAPNSISAGAPPQTPLGELTALHQPPSWI